MPKNEILIQNFLLKNGLFFSDFHFYNFVKTIKNIFFVSYKKVSPGGKISYTILLVGT